MIFFLTTAGSFVKKKWRWNHTIYGVRILGGWPVGPIVTSIFWLWYALIKNKDWEWNCGHAENGYTIRLNWWFLQWLDLAWCEDTLHEKTLKEIQETEEKLRPVGFERFWVLLSRMANMFSCKIISEKVKYGSWIRPWTDGCLRCYCTQLFRYFPSTVALVVLVFVWPVQGPLNLMIWLLDGSKPPTINHCGRNPTDGGQFIPC